MKHRIFKLLLLLCGFWILFIGCVQARTLAEAGVASAHPVATAAGVSMLRMGGNAFDAATAVSAALAVVEPSGSGIGGGGFWLLYDAESAESLMVDGREKAPLASTRDMYLDRQSEIIPRLSIDGALAAGIPGEPAALAWLAENYASLDLSTMLQPAIDAARNGFVVTERYQRLAKWRKDVLNQYPESARIFLDNGEVPQLGHRIIQEDLANTLELFAKKGHDGFYRGKTAMALVEGNRRTGGNWTLSDLSKYQVKIRDPIEILYRDMRITSAALPSSGGLVLAEILNILEHYDLISMKREDVMHLVVEAMRLAYRDRAEYMGDADFVDVPSEMLTSKAYAADLANSIQMGQAADSLDLSQPLIPSIGKGEDTTHFSIIDKWGNRVSATLSINYPFGSGVVATGTGVLLNDEMDDFSAKPRTPNVYGLIGSSANLIVPEKRMLSSMSPTFVENKERIAVLGTPGGSRIITMVLLALLEFEKGAGANEIVQLPRYHHQYLPDQIQYEKASLDQQAISTLVNRGHKFKELNRTWGNMNVVVLDKLKNKIDAAVDPRGEGSAQILR